MIDFYILFDNSGILLLVKIKLVYVKNDNTLFSSTPLYIKHNHSLFICFPIALDLSSILLKSNKNI